MKKKLIEFLVCPDCQGSLECQIFRQDQSLPWHEILEGCLTCDSCGQKYPINRGIPRMMIGLQPGEVEDTVEGFGWQWQKFDRKIQQSYMSRKALFLDFIYPVDEASFEGKMVLDAGCGMGRFLKMGAQFGSREIIGVDLSESVNAAYHNTGHLPNAHIVQADIMALPFRSEFDLIFSIGVLHHLANPRSGFAHLSRLLKKNGRISVWVYGEENNAWVKNIISPLRKNITSRLPKPLLYVLSHFLGIFLYLVLKLVYKPVNEVFKLGRILPYNDYLYYSARMDYAALVNVIFDHLVPQLAHYISREEFESWFREEKLFPVSITSRNNMSWRGLAVRGEKVPKVTKVS